MEVRGREREEEEDDDNDERDTRRKGEVTKIQRKRERSLTIIREERELTNKGERESCGTSFTVQNSEWSNRQCFSSTVSYGVWQQAVSGQGAHFRNGFYRSVSPVWTSLSTYLSHRERGEREREREFRKENDKREVRYEYLERRERERERV